MVRFLLGLTLLSVLSCSENSEDKSSIFFGGEIVNPTSDYVVLYHNDAYVDSVKLDDHNRFAFNLNNLEEGLYHFDHTPELQYVYLEQGDSLLARLNTVEFDESLVFSGKGSEINNFLIEMFLDYEMEVPQVESYYSLDPEMFSHKIDSLHNEKIKHLNELALDNQFSDRVMAIAQAAVDYNSYISKEKYPFFHKKQSGEETFHSLPDSFYDYRKTIDLNNEDFIYLKPYYDFMKWHFGNIAYMTCLNNCTEDKRLLKKSLHFNKHKLALADSLVHEVELRNMLFRNIAIDYLLKEHHPGPESQAFIDRYSELSSNENQKEEIRQLYRGIKNLQPNKPLPDLSLKDFEGNDVSLKAVANDKKNTIFYFWTASQKKHFMNVYKQINDLEHKYPQYSFVGINLRTSFPKWQELLDEYQLDKSKQFYGKNFKEIQTGMFIDKLNKCVITKDSLVVNGFAYLSNINKSL